MSTRRQLAVLAGVNLALVAALALSVVQGITAPAVAGGGCPTWNSETGELDYSNCQGGSTTSPGHPGGGGHEPTCDLVAPATFCQGATPCYIKDVVTPFAPPPGPPPEGMGPGDWHVVMCLRGGAWMGTAVWDTEPQPPSLFEQAQTAYGKLTAPSATLAFNPPARTIVNIQTWFWADGLTDQAITGSSAFGLVAIAEPDHLLVDPGDGSGELACPWTVAASEACEYQYSRSSLAGTFPATAQAAWTVRFELGGTRINIPGAPTRFLGPTMSTAVDVDEIQTVVTD